MHGQLMRSSRWELSPQTGADEVFLVSLLCGDCGTCHMGFKDSAGPVWTAVGRPRATPPQRLHLGHRVVILILRVLYVFLGLPYHFQ